MDNRCTVGEGFPEHCTHEAAYAAAWTNGDEGALCVEHAAWVREHSDDLAVMETLGKGRERMETYRDGGSSDDRT